MLGKACDLSAQLKIFCLLKKYNPYILVYSRGRNGGLVDAADTAEDSLSPGAVFLRDGEWAVFFCEHTNVEHAAGFATLSPEELLPVLMWQGYTGAAFPRGQGQLSCF